MRSASTCGSTESNYYAAEGPPRMPTINISRRGLSFGAHSSLGRLRDGCHLGRRQRDHEAGGSRCAWERLSGDCYQGRGVFVCADRSYLLCADSLGPSHRKQHSPRVDCRSALSKPPQIDRSKGKYSGAHSSVRVECPNGAISGHLGPGRLRSACFFMRPPQRLGSSIPPRR
jgi:hypothetical protein